MKRRERIAAPTRAMPDDLERFDEADWLDVVPPPDIPATPWRRLAWNRARRAHTRPPATPKESR